MRCREFDEVVFVASGRRIIEDHKEAVKWYRLAAEQGDANAQYNLGVMYVLGEGVIQDDVYAHMWLNIAAASGVEGRQNQKRHPSQIRTHDTSRHLQGSRPSSRMCEKEL